MIDRQILIDFINLQNSFEAKDIKCTNKSLSFVAPNCLKTIIVDSFEPISFSVSVSDFNYNYSFYVIQ